MAAITAELGDIQGNILRSYGFPFARYQVVRIVERDGARRILERLLDRQLITTAATWDPSSKPSATLNVFFSWAGLAAMGVPQASLDSFPEEFREGMAARAALLNDTGKNAPETWEFGHDADRNHVFFAVYGRTLADRDRMLGTLRDELTAAGPAIEVTHRLDAGMLANRQEHFGFADGIGQPAIEGSGVPFYAGEGTLQPDGTWAPLKAGEFVLGWPGETGRPLAMPEPDILARNGSFLVYRKLEQHVSAFRSFLATEAARLYGDASASKVELLAAKLVGRWRSGCPLALSPDADDPALAEDWARNNDFGYAADPGRRHLPLWLACPPDESARRSLRGGPRPHAPHRAARAAVRKPARGRHRRRPGAWRGVHGHQRQHPVSVRVPADRMGQQRRVREPVQDRHRSVCRRAARGLTVPNPGAAGQAEEHLQSSHGS